ncbi:MAG: phosphotransferase family protein, partial [Sulfobacillus sp.]
MIIREYYQRSAPDPVLDPQLVLNLVRRHVPEAMAVTAVDESGGEARTYYVDANVVLKVQRPPQLRSWTSLEKEVVFLRQIEADDPALPVPRVLGYGREGTVEYTCLTRMAGDAAVRTPIPEAVRADTLHDLGRVVRRVHAIQQAPLKASGLFPEEFTPDDLRASIDEDITDLAARMASQQLVWPLAMPAADLAKELTSLVPERTLAIALHTNPGPTHTFVDATTG